MISFAKFLERKIKDYKLDEDLGVKHAIYNIPLSMILGETTNTACPTIYYDFRGKTYQFNGAAINGYDYLFSYLTSLDMISTAIVLNDWDENNPQLIHPKSGRRRILLCI